MQEVFDDGEEVQVPRAHAMETKRPNDVARAMVYNEYFRNEFYPEVIPGYSEASPMVRGLIRYWINKRKIIGSRSMAIELMCDPKPWKNRTPPTEFEVDEAYAIGASGGLEYEWPME